MRRLPLDPVRWSTGITGAVLAAGVAALAATDLQAMPVGLAFLLLILAGYLSRVYRYGDIAGLLLGCGAYAILEQNRVGGGGLAAWIAATVSFAAAVVALRFQEEQVRAGESHIERMHQVAEDLTLADGSGLLKRRYGELALEEEVKRARRTKADLCLLLVATDPVSDQPEGEPHDSEADAVLIGDLVRRMLRSCDRGIRLGPSMFAAILPATAAGGGSIAAHKLRLEAEHEGGCALRCGVAAFPRHAVSAAELLEEAEAALGIARAAGLPVVSPTMLHKFAAT
jgi:GGDEF domain-containing protein